MTEYSRPPKTIPLTLRLPTAQHEELTKIAKAKGWSLNDEIAFRLRAFALHEQMVAVTADVAEIKTIVRRIADTD